jgi:hypothetical protein
MAEAAIAESPSDIEGAWYIALVQAERLRQDYVQHERAADIAELEPESLWLLLWLAERRRDELFCLLR